MATRSTSASGRRGPAKGRRPTQSPTVQWLALGIAVLLLILAAFVFFSGSTVLSQ